MAEIEPDTGLDASEIVMPTEVLDPGVTLSTDPVIVRDVIKRTTPDAPSVEDLMGALARGHRQGPEALRLLRIGAREVTRLSLMPDEAYQRGAADLFGILRSLHDRERLSRTGAVTVVEDVSSATTLHTVDDSEPEKWAS